MKDVGRQDVVEALYEAELVESYDDYSIVRFNYSGRGMYGKECLGIIGTVGDVIKFVAAIADHQDETVRDLIDEWGDPVADSMGRDTIYYWPQVQIKE